MKQLVEYEKGLRQYPNNFLDRKKFYKTTFFFEI